MIRVVFVSGSSKGLGYYIAKKFLENGDRVIINGTNKYELQKSYNRLIKIHKKSNILAISGDVKEETFLKKAKQLIKKKFKALNIIVSNAGRLRLNGKLLNNKEMLKYNYKTALNFSNFFKKDIISSKNGSIIFISSIAAITKTTAPKGYVEAKSRINKLGKKLALELSKKNVNVNVISPGNILIKNGNWDDKIKKNKKEVMNYIKKNVPMKRFASPEEVSNLCLFLSEKESKFITGQIISIDGGQSIKNEIRKNL